MGDQFPKIRVAAVHAASVFLDRNESTNKTCDLIADAGGKGAQLVVFPETFIPGYPYWIWTHTPTTGAPFFHDLFTNSVEVPSETTKALGEAAKKAGTYLAIGISERMGGTLYNTILYIDDQGQIMGCHRKLQPTSAERMIWGRGDGSDLFILDTPFGRLGGLICLEHSMDLVRYAMACLGEQIHVALWPAISAVSHNPRSSMFDSISESAAKHHAFAAQAFVINVQSCIDQATLKRLGLENQPDMCRTGGGWTAIIGPNGQIIAGPNKDEETIVYGDIDINDIVLVKYTCDSTGHYARPDVVRLLMNLASQPVSEVSDFSRNQMTQALRDETQGEPDS